MKNLQIKFPNGDIFEVPAEVIARQRTQYYADVDGFKEGSKEWDDEFKQSMTEYELMDWVQNNTDWKNISHEASKMQSKEVDYNELWFEADFKIV
jgi:hypothetical protein